MQVIISGDSGSVGLDMEWADHIIHWSQRKSFGMITQKTWRLDRRIDPTELGTVINKVYNVHHFIKSDKRAKHVDEINEKYRKNRILLGTRQNQQQEEKMSFGYLLPPNDNLTIEKWSDSAKLFEPIGGESTWLWQFIEGKVGSVNVIAEQLALKSIESVTGLNLDITKSTFTPKEQTIVESNEYIDARRLFILHNLTKDPNELLFLRQYSGGIRDPKKKVLPSSSQSLDREFRDSTPTLLPNGEFHKFFNKRLIEIWMRQKKFDHYPFVCNYDDFNREYSHKNKELLNSIKPMKIALHIGMFSLMTSEQYIEIHSKIRHELGGDSPCGLVVRKINGNWEFLTLNDLNKLEYMFEGILNDSVKKLYPEESFPQENNCTVEDYNEANLNYITHIQSIIQNFEDLAFDLRLQIKLEDLRKDKIFDKLNQLIPLIHIHDDEKEREPCCPVCNKSSNYLEVCEDSYCSEWEPLFNYVIGGWC